ncbi:protrudin isoform X2 [Rhineura floridana]|nr:protrudin isoform X2 [Rhineura floridana]XP_061492278.1 protrudin isoform X2 [Rhineura floridana]XP_061492279.1 protrudin isoform X2 [Rhineura floridana]XP_061492281.1 protrudin isoform X2 [Rhineura floridana]XP_061492282.1 protrudin isoform X2 [Rhineura floridana]XP_061492283.1 protrudin isoform X2 [Rhineura floridana]
MQVSEREGGATTGNGQDSPTTSDSQQVSPLPPKPPSFDLFNLVVSYKRLELYLEPLQDVAEGLWFLLSWQMPLCSLLTCLGLNFLLLTLNEAAWYGLCVLLISVPAMLGYLQETCRIRLTEEELARRRYHSVRREDVRKVQLSRHEAVAEVKGFLIQLEALLSRLCGGCEAVYRVLYWENPSLSSQFYGMLMVSVCALYLLPLCWVFVLLNNALFLGNVAFYQVLLELKSAVEQRLGLKPIATTPELVELEAGDVGAAALPDRTPTPTSTEDLTPGSVEEAEEAEPDDEFKDAIEDDDDVSQCSGEFDLGLPDNPFMSKNEVIRSRVSRLTERLRKRYPTNNLGNCASCSATFSVLKKRRCCSNCGNSFCSRCCSFKVPKSCMGATAPDAQRETVFVCGQCNQALIK